MAKKKKIKKKVLVALTVVLFFVCYFLGFNLFKDKDTKDKEPGQQTTEALEDDTRPLIKQLSSKDKIYLSDSKVENVRIEKDYWDNITVLFTEFTKIRKPQSYTPIYNGNSDDGIRFSTDLNYFRVYTVSKEEYYKVPVATKKELSKLLSESIYLSFDFIKKHKSWDTVKVTYKDETKKIFGWDFKELARKMAQNRMVGKVQPEKSKERSKYNFTINIEGENYDVKVETMGKDYVKITQGEGKNKIQAYYEVHTGLYDYLVKDIFKLEE